MKIYSWNMLFSNKRHDEAFAFIRDSDSDIFCLQEVPEVFLARLRTLSCELVAAPEADRRLVSEHATNYLVILSKYPIRAHAHIPLPHRKPSFLAQAFTGFMHTLRLRAKLIGNRHSLYADIETAHGLVRVFCLHLPLTHPSMRAEEFELALAHLDSMYPAIVCGDFNILESLHVTPLNWLSGGSVRDVISLRRERRCLEERFFAYELTNAHRGHSTHPISRSQLDHILVQNTFTITHAAVIRRRAGSDHRPILVEVTHQETV